MCQIDADLRDVLRDRRKTTTGRRPEACMNSMPSSILERMGRFPLNKSPLGRQKAVVRAGRLSSERLVMETRLFPVQYSRSSCTS
jgi:hypothetical protein